MKFGLYAFRTPSVLLCRTTGSSSTALFCLLEVGSRTGLHNTRPVGRMWPAISFLAVRENSVAENVAKARLRIITCPFRISSTLWRNRLLRPAASLCWSIWPFELSELCRPVLDYYWSLIAISAFLTTETTAHPCYNQTRRAPRSPWSGAQCTYFPKPELGRWKEWIPHTKTKAISKWKWRLKRTISIKKKNNKQALKLSKTKISQNLSHKSNNQTPRQPSNQLLLPSKLPGCRAVGTAPRTPRPGGGPSHV